MAIWDLSEYSDKELKKLNYQIDELKELGIELNKTAQREINKELKLRGMIR